MFCRNLLEIDELGTSPFRYHAGFSLPVIAEEGLCVHDDNHSALLGQVNSSALLATNGRLLWNRRVDNKAIRRRNLAKLVGEFKTLAAIAKLGDLSEATLSQYKTGHRKMGDRFARKLEVAVDKPPGWMDVPHAQSPEDAVEQQEAIYILRALSAADKEAWLKLGRSLADKVPPGPANGGSK